jgi:hypothetical protein
LIGALKSAISATKLRAVFDQEATGIGLRLKPMV